MRPNIPANTTRGELDLDLGPLKLRLCFRTYAYRAFEKLTGISHFQRLNKMNEFSLEHLGMLIFAASAKYHAQDSHVTLDEVNEALDNLAGYEMHDVSKQVLNAFYESIKKPAELPPSGPATPMEKPAAV